MKERGEVFGPPETRQPDRLTGIVRTGSPSSFVWALFIPLVSLAILVALAFLFSGNPASTLFFFFLGPLRNIYSFGNMLNSAVPLIFGALGVTVAMKAGSLNLGGEGQVYSGAFVAAAAGFALPSLGIAGGILAVLAGAFFAGAVAALCGLCKARWNANELITTFLLSGVTIPVVNYMVTGPFLDPGTSLQSTAKIAAALRLPVILPPSNLSAALFIALAATLVTWIFLNKTKTGYEFRMAGDNEVFARYGGINTKLNTVLAMFVSGAFYGLAGSLAVFGTYYAVIKEFSLGLGWNGLAVALIAGFSPAAIIPAALFFAWISSGARIAMQNSGLTIEAASIVQSVIFFLSTSMAIRNFFARKGHE
jgi:simple sugar transport system permease protein